MKTFSEKIAGFAPTKIYRLLRRRGVVASEALRLAKGHFLQEVLNARLMDGYGWKAFRGAGQSYADLNRRQGHYGGYHLQANDARFEGVRNEPRKGYTPPRPWSYDYHNHPVAL